jgi:hypothetical protein
MANDYLWPTPGEGQMWFTYVPDDYNGENGAYGTMQADDYHVAMFIPTEVIPEGTKIENLRFWMAALSVTNMSIWASTFLPDDGQTPDLCQTSFTYDDREQREVNGRVMDTYFYNIPFDGDVFVSGEGIYVGFSFTVDHISTKIVGGVEQEYMWDCMPLAYIENGVNPYSFFLRASSRGAWSNWGEANSAQYLMGALMSGSGRENAVNVEGFGTVYNVKDEEPQLPVTLSALGSAGANSIDFVVTEADGTESEPIHLDLSQSIAFGARAVVNLPLPAESAVGRQVKTITVTQVNGQPNESVKNIATGNVITLSERVTRKPTVEEFTATWSGKGPRGIVARERMKVNFPDQLVIIANHMNSATKNDPMALDYYFEQAMPGANAADFVPQTAINRVKVVDSYFGSTPGKNNAIRLDLNEAVKELAPAQLTLTPRWDADEAVVTINTDVNFLYSDDEGTYALAYVVTEDGMQGDTEEWNQENTYSGNTWLDASDWLIPWTQKRPSVSGVIYDDVAIAALGIGSGLEGSLSPVFQEGTPLRHTITYDVDSNELVQDKSRLKVAVLLFNTETGEIVNAEQTEILPPEEHLFKPSTVENPIWYQLQSGDEYLGWYDYGAIYTKLEGVTPESIDDVDKLEWAFIPSDEGYRLLNKAKSQFMGVVENYVNLSEEGIVWTVDEFKEDGYITFSCSDGALYSSYFVQVGNRTPAHFTPIEMVPPIPTALNAVSYSSVDEVYDLQGRRIGSQVKNLPAGIYMVNGRKVVVR